jgi:hypothetical protein
MIEMIVEIEYRLISYESHKRGSQDGKKGKEEYIYNDDLVNCKKLSAIT